MSGILIDDDVMCPYCGAVNDNIEFECDEGHNHLMKECTDCDQPFVVHVHVIVSPALVLKVQGCFDKDELPDKFTPRRREGYPQSVGEDPPPHAEDR